SHRGQLQSRGTYVLRLLDGGLHARFAGAGGGAGARRAGRPGAAARRLRRSRLYSIQARGRDPVQSGAGGATLSADPARPRPSVKAVRSQPSGAKQATSSEIMSSENQTSGAKQSPIMV